MCKACKIWKNDKNLLEFYEVFFKLEYLLLQASQAESNEGMVSEPRGANDCFLRQKSKNSKDSDKISYQRKDSKESIKTISEIL